MKLFFKLVVLITILAKLNTSLCFGQQLHNEYLAKLNYRNVTFTRTDSIPGVTWISDNAAYDENHHRFFFQANRTAVRPFNLYTIDAQTGAVLYNPLIPSNLSQSTDLFGLEYDNATDTLYGIYRDTLDAFHFAWVEPATGAVHIKSDFTTIGGYTGSSSTYDKNHHYYIFEGIGTGLTQPFIIDAHTGKIVYSPPFSKSNGVEYLKYDYIKNTLYGVAFAGGALEFDSIELRTGIQHKIAGLPMVGLSQTGESTIVEDSGRYIFVGASTTMGDSATLYTLDELTGAIIYQADFRYSNASLTSGENLINFCFDNKTDTLYALNWGPSHCSETAGIVSATRDTVCFGTPIKLNLSGSIGTIQWQADTTGNFFPIQGNTNSASLNFPYPTSLHFRVVAGSGSCTDTSSGVAVTVVSSPVSHFTYTSPGNSLTFQFNSDSTIGATHYSWNFGDSTAPDNSINPTHTFAKTDTFYVCLTTSNNSNCSYTYCRYIAASVFTGINNVTAGNLWNIYPNPANGQFIIKTNAQDNDDKTARIEIINMAGQKIMSRLINTVTLQAGEYFNLSEGAAPGNYIIRITTASHVYIGKLNIIR